MTGQQTILESQGNKPVINRLHWISQDYLVIESDDEFYYMADLNNWLGSGMEGDPIIVNGTYIEFCCISISNTRVYFEFVDCLISSESQSPNPGIWLYNVTYGKIRNTIVEKHSDGFELVDCDSCILTNNIVVGGNAGFLLYDSTECSLIDNTAVGCDWGFLLDGSDNCELTGNVAWGNDVGFCLYESDACTLTKNEAGYMDDVPLYNLCGFWLEESEYNSLWNNSASYNSENGFCLFRAHSNELYFNLARSNQHNGFLFIDSWGVDIVFNSARSNDLHGFAFKDSGGCEMWHNEALWNWRSGFYLEESNYALLHDNTAIENYEHGFCLNSSHEAELDSNTAQDNYYHGFYLNTSTYCDLFVNYAIGNMLHGYCIEKSEQTFIAWNVANLNHDHGFSMNGSMADRLYNNSAGGNGYTGFYLQNMQGTNIQYNNAWFDSNHGFYLLSSRECEFTGNEAIHCGHSGFALSNVNNSLLTNNIASMNLINGILIQLASCNNTLYQNRIFDNSGAEAVDDGEYNFWDDGVSKGNYWGNYNRTGWYFIPGSAGSIDHYPNEWPLTPPIIDSPLDIEYEAGTTGHNITWNPSDEDPWRYEVYRNGMLIDNRDWDGSPVTVNVTGLTVGSYNYTLSVYDIFGTSTSDIVFVVIVDTTPPTIDCPPDLEYEEGTTEHSIIWSPSDASVGYYEIYRNGSMIDDGEWNGSLVSINIDDLLLGVYNHTLVVYDVSYNRISDTVFVTVVDTTPPSIDTVPDINYQEGTTGHSITWSPTDRNPWRYEIYRNGSLIEEDVWDGSPIPLNVEGLSIGIYNFTLVVYDTSENSNQDTVFVTVNEVTSTTVTDTTTSGMTTETQSSPSDLLISVGIAVVAIIILFIAVFRFRRST